MDSLQQDSRLGMGGNNPPDPIELLRATLRETYAETIARAAELLGMAERLPGTMDDEWEARISEAIKSCAKFTKNAEATRLAANEPYRALIAASDGFFKAMSDKVDALKKKMASDYLTPYQQLKADAEKRRREEAAREAKARADEEARLAREEAFRVAEARRVEEAARAEVERLKRERIAAEEKRKAAAIAEAERAEAARQEAIRLEEEAKNKKQRAAAAAARDKADREAAENEAAAKRDRDAAKAKDKAERDEAARIEAEAKASRKEQERVAAEARDRSAVATQANNRAGRALNANTAELSRTRTDLGAVASLKTTWLHEVTDAALVPRLYLRVDEGALAAAVKAATQDGKCTLQIDGVRIYPVADSVVR